MPTNHRPAKLRSIQYLRGLAAIAVVVYHSFVQLGRLGYDGRPLDVLSSGVDIFFVISGFIMWYTTFKVDINTTEFLKHRIIRIVPLYWLVTSFYVLVLLTRPHWMQSTTFELWHILASYLFIPTPSPIPPHLMWPLVVPGWTINFEMAFYLLFGLSLLWPSRYRAIAVTALLAVIASLHSFEVSRNSIFGFYSSNIVLEFAFGVALGWFYTSTLNVAKIIPYCLMVSGLGCLIAFVEIPGLMRVIAYGIPALLIVGGAVLYERTNSIVAGRLPELLGDASYSIYLVHGATLSAFAQIWRLCALPRTSQPIIICLFVVSATVVATAAGILIYRLVERPMLRKMSAYAKRRSTQRLIVDNPRT